MTTPQDPRAEPSKSAGLPRWLVPLFWAGGVLLVHMAVPWGISWLSTRYGWEAGRPGILNLFALILILTGLVGVGWTLALHFVRAPQKVEFERLPKYLLRQGPYGLTRNPMYLAVLTLWLGWALFYGSIAVLIGCLLLWAAMNFRVVPREERELEARFGEAYRQYKHIVPRWFEKVRSDTQRR